MDDPILIEVLNMLEIRKDTMGIDWVFPASVHAKVLNWDRGSDVWRDSSFSFPEDLLDSVAREYLAAARRQAEHRGAKRIAEVQDAYDAFLLNPSVARIVVLARLARE